MSESKRDERYFKDFLKRMVLCKLQERGHEITEERIAIVNTEIEALTNDELEKIRNGEKVDICTER